MWLGVSATKTTLISDEEGEMSGHHQSLDPQAPFTPTKHTPPTIHNVLSSTGSERGGHPQAASEDGSQVVVTPDAHERRQERTNGERRTGQSARRWQQWIDDRDPRPGGPGCPLAPYPPHQRCCSGSGRGCSPTARKGSTASGNGGTGRACR